MPEKCRVPCNECPFNPKSVLGPTAHGAFDPEQVLAQAYGPFVLPCHKDPAYQGKETDVSETLQCAGAAVFRSNVAADMQWELPAALLKLPADQQQVFSTAAEFMAYHTGTTVLQAQRALDEIHPREMAIKELSKSENKLYTPNTMQKIEAVMTESLIRNEENIVRFALMQHLFRIPDKQDFRDCAKVYESSASINYIFCYQNKPLGRVIFALEKLPPGVTFHPWKETDKMPDFSVSSC